MVKMKKIGVVLTSTAFTLSMFAPVASATTMPNEHSEKVQILVASTDSTVTKNDLVKRFREMFPNQFTFLKDSDFHMGSGHYFPEDETVRYDLMFNKSINGKDVYGSISFAGESLEIVGFHFEPANTKDALFPAKYSKENAQIIAQNFIKKLPNAGNYKLETNELYNYYGTPLLTEPIRYPFMFVRTENGLPIQDQNIQITVLGNGEIVEFYKSTNNEKVTFDSLEQKKAEAEIAEQYRSNLSVDLRYQVNYDYRSGERKVDLVYAPTSQVLGVHAISGKWQTEVGFVTELPKARTVEKITAEPLPPKYNGIKVEKAKALAEQLLKIDSDKVKLNIDSISEEDYDGQAVIRIHYMYETEDYGTGTTLEINKQTGEIIQYHNLKSEVLKQDGEKAAVISEQEALTQAVNHLKTWAPSYLHNYVMPVEKPNFDKKSGEPGFSFPRVVNGITVTDDNIYVTIGADGSLIGLNVSYQPVDKWPDVNNVISAEKAKEMYKESLKMKLQYTMQEPESKDKNTHYNLVYSPTFQDKMYSVLNANTGEWMSMLGDNTSATPPVISHPKAEEELNYLINAKILDVKNVDTFNADTAISKGEALNVIMKSLTYFYEDYYGDEQESKDQTFDDIGPKHDLYNAVERAVSNGILDTKSKTFNANTNLTKEELAVWYIRALKLEEAAKHSDIYKPNFVDADQVKKEYLGHVALANSLGLLKADQNQFNPKKEVTYAELAVSIINLAHEKSLKDRNNDF